VSYKSDIQKSKFNRVNHDGDDDARVTKLFGCTCRQQIGMDRTCKKIKNKP